MSEHVLGRVGVGVKFHFVRTFALEEGRGIAFGGIGREPSQDVEQLGHAGAVSRRDEAYRYQVSLTQGRFERRVQLIGADFALLEV